MHHLFRRALILLQFVSLFLLCRMPRRIRSSFAPLCICFICCDLFLCFCSSGCVGGFACHLFRRSSVFFFAICFFMSVEQDAWEDSCVICSVVHFLYVFKFLSVFLLSRMREGIRTSSVSSCACFVSCHLFIPVAQDTWEDSRVICVVVHLFCSLQLFFISVEQESREDSRVICFVAHSLFVAMCSFLSVEQDAWEVSRVICFVVLLEQDAWEDSRFMCCVVHLFCLLPHSFSVEQDAWKDLHATCFVVHLFCVVAIWLQSFDSPWCVGGFARRLFHRDFFLLSYAPSCPLSGMLGRIRAPTPSWGICLLQFVFQILLNRIHAREDSRVICICVIVPLFCL